MGATVRLGLGLLLALGGAACQPGFIKADKLESRGQGPSACAKSCEGIGMRMAAMVLMGDETPGCVCQPLTVQPSAAPGVAPSPSSSAVPAPLPSVAPPPAAAPSAPAPTPSTPAEPAGPPSQPQSANEPAGTSTADAQVLAAAAGMVRGNHVRAQEKAQQAAIH
jgi:hypothetical protein